ncbi:MAG: DMT family transporter [Lachnospiraceae bacterium]|nr:DMT family transporter [Lachnospiraceae bacterium]MDE5780673.1 DMT family transporter [Lachnospiraceae bacterium]MDE6252359.1 DMT family transporter [Lachnospiraceae bacterium]
MGFIIALISGVLMSVQGVFNTQVTKGTSMWVSNSWVQISAFIVCIGAWLFTDRKSFMGLLNVSPKYMLLGGVIGAFITYTVIKSMAMMGPAKAVMIIVISQIVSAYLIELIGMFGVEKSDFQWQKFVWAAVATVGVFMFSK